MSKATDARFGIVEHDRDARAQADRVHRARTGEDVDVAQLHENGLLAHAFTNTRSRAINGLKSDAARPTRLSTFPSTSMPPGASASWNLTNSCSWIARSK